MPPIPSSDCSFLDLSKINGLIGRSYNNHSSGDPDEYGSEVADSEEEFVEGSDLEEAAGGYGRLPATTIQNGLPRGDSMASDCSSEDDNDQPRSLEHKHRRYRLHRLSSSRSSRSSRSSLSEIGGDRRVVEISDDEEASSNDNWLTDQPNEILDAEARAQESKPLHSISLNDFIYPLSIFEGHVAPLPRTEEVEVVGEFMKEIERQRSTSQELPLGVNDTFGDEEFIEFELSDFSIYFPEPQKKYGGTMTGLQNLTAKITNSFYCFDGILSLGVQRRYVQCVPFKLSSIGNYGAEYDAVGDNLWIQSSINQKSNVFYQLKTPSAQYQRYHDGFVWLSNLAKHFVDYLDWASGKGKKVSIHDFRAEFASWLEKKHGKSIAYQEWYDQYNHQDFRSHIAANVDFLWNEAVCVSKTLSQHSIWNEVRSMDFIPQQILREKRTVVTPYVFDCFRHLKLGINLLKVTQSDEINRLRKSTGEAQNLSTIVTSTSSGKLSKRPKLDKATISVGDVLAVLMDEKAISNWKDEPSKWKSTDECWYVLVQQIHVDKKGVRSFDIVWLYKPSDTSCAMMRYPYDNELFMSDNCNCRCGEQPMRRLTEDEVLYKIHVVWNGAPGAADFFVRQTFISSNAFITFNESHKTCVHLHDQLKPPLQELVDQYQIGDTVLFVPASDLKSKHGLEPGEIMEFVQDGTEGHVSIRPFPRRHDLEGGNKAAPNELVYSDKIVSIKASMVRRRCFIRYYTKSEIDNREIPAPYNRNGTGDAFYIVTRLTEEGLEAIGPDTQSSMKQGIDFKRQPQQDRLRGLDMFCGGGSFGRGLEEGGGIHNTHAVDLNGNAIHTHHANLENPKATAFYYGSVNDMLAAALKDPSKSKLVPLPGDIDFISAGSPCPGFSKANPLRNSEKGLRDQSLVASVAAFIDVYRPKYALLENVITMGKANQGRDEDVLSQLICCIVGMGYQVDVFNLDAWSFGSPQTRSRLFVSITAPGLEPPRCPAPSHSHPQHTSDRKLGKMANGLGFGERQFEPTPFEFVTAGEATADLPNIGDGRTSQCIQHSDHRMPAGISAETKARMEAIPMTPWGMTYSKTYDAGLLSEAQQALFLRVTKAGTARQSMMRGSRAWGRIHPRKLIPTIATTESPVCGRTGRCLHWNQQRLLTVLEARRAQSYPDNEVLTGSPAQQWRIVGNSVDRSVSLALGLSIGEAWRNSFFRAESPVGIASDARYHSSIHEQGPTSPARESSSIRSNTELGDQVHLKAKKRRHDLPEPTTQSVKKKKLLGLASKRDPRTTRIPDDGHPGKAHSKIPADVRQPKQDHVSCKKEPESPTFKETVLARKFRVEQEQRKLETSLLKSSTSVAMYRGPKALSSPSKPPEIIDLISDDEAIDEDEDEHYILETDKERITTRVIDEEEVDFMASAKKKNSGYIPVDNNFASAYSQTKSTMRLNRQQK